MPYGCRNRGRFVAINDFLVSAVLLRCTNVGSLYNFWQDRQLALILLTLLIFTVTFLALLSSARLLQILHCVHSESRNSHSSETPHLTQLPRCWTVDRSCSTHQSIWQSTKAAVPIASRSFFFVSRLSVLRYASGHAELEK